MGLIRKSEIEKLYVNSFNVSSVGGRKRGGIKLTCIVSPFWSLLLLIFFLISNDNYYNYYYNKKYIIITIGFIIDVIWW